MTHPGSEMFLFQVVLCPSRLTNVANVMFFNHCPTVRGGALTQVKVCLWFYCCDVMKRNKLRLDSKHQHWRTTKLALLAVPVVRSELVALSQLSLSNIHCVTLEDLSRNSDTQWSHSRLQLSLVYYGSPVDTCTTFFFFLVLLLEDAPYCSLSTLGLLRKNILVQDGS